MALELRPWEAALILCGVLVLGTVGSAAVAEVTEGPEYDPSGEYVAVHEPLDDETTYLWPYTTRAPNHGTRTLAINMIVYGDVDATERYLRGSTRGEWNETDEDEEDAHPAEESDDETVRVWGAATGSTRYSFISFGNSGMWMTESYQLHDGDYLGSRHHIRAYTSPYAGEEWTAIQTHREHWDWFQLRHTVDSVEESQNYVEAEFMGAWFVEDLWREHLDNGVGSDANGWVTVVELRQYDTAEDASLAGAFGGLIGTIVATPAALAALTGTLVGLSALGATATERARRYRRGLETVCPPEVQRAIALATGIISLYLFVRFGAIAAEHALPVSPKTIAVIFYPLVFAGLPITAYLFARQLQRPMAFSGASVGFIVAIMLDYSYVGVAVLPHDVLVHRVALAVALGLIAVGASRPERHASAEAGHVRTGVLIWVVALGLPLLQFF